MSTEQDELLQRIAAVAGQINRHKNAQHAEPPDSRYSPYPRPNTTWQAGRGSSRGLRGGYRGSRGRGAYVAPHRNRTLVINSTQAVDSNHQAADFPSRGTDSASGQAFVSRRDRHAQLINKSIVDKVNQERTAALEKSRLEKLKKREQRQAMKVQRYVEQQAAQTGQGGYPRGLLQEIEIDGLRYKQSSGSNRKLIRVTDEHSSAKSTPKRVTLGDVTFIRSKNGNLWRSDQRKPSTKKIDKPCSFYTLTGKCARAESCRYNHDPNHVAVCQKFLQDSCPDGLACSLSHTPNAHNSPHCVHFARGSCNNGSTCKYSHVRVSPIAPICRSFALEGWCERGEECPERHVYECPDFDETGSCKRKNCRLSHTIHAGRQRVAAAAAAAKAKEEKIGTDSDSEISSDEDPIDSDDVDSEELSDDESLVVPQAGESQEIRGQRDFVPF